VTLAAITNSVPLARRLVREVTRHWHLPDELADNAGLIMSELATNAVKATVEYHAARGIPEVGRIKLSLRWNRPNLVTEVWDINPLLPVRKQAGEDAESGRGLGIPALSARGNGATRSSF
jgi:anti-sigma regulatory factor (Ser/Thr protein kinase)